MILVDTSVWIDHLSASNPMLANLLIEERVLSHLFVIGEIALGSLRDRDVVLDALLSLPRAPISTPEETFHLIERERPIAGSGMSTLYYWRPHASFPARPSGRATSA